MKMIKICHVASADITVKFLLMPQLKSLLNEGHEVFVVCSAGKLIEEIKKEGIKVKIILITRKYFSPISDLIALFKLFFYFKKEKFDIVHTHAPKSALLGQLAAKMAGVPSIVNTIHGLYFTENSSFFRRKLFTLTEKVSAKCSTVIFSQNKEDIETIVRERISLPEKIKYLGNGIDLERFNSDKFSVGSQDLSALAENPDLDFILKKKKELGIDANQKIIGTVGRLVQEKGYMDLFESMKTVLKEYPDALLLVVGPQEHDKKDKFSPSIVEKYGIGKNVKFLGERNDIDELYPIMDIFVLASHREGFPRSVIEAMAMEKPIIVTDIRGCREEITHDKEGMVVPVKNPEKLSKAILFLLDNPEKAKEMACRAKDKAKSEFDEKLVFERLKQEYNNMLVKSKKYLVVGGAGFIGSHLVENLSLKNEVIVIDKKNIFISSENKNIKFFNIDASNSKIIDIIEKEKPEVVYYLAGPIGLRKDMHSQEFKDALNVFLGLKNTIKATSLIKAKFVFVSSGGAIFANTNTVPVNETQEPSPDSIYGFSNLILEGMIGQSALNHTILRFSNIYGPGQWSDGVIPSFTKSILHNQPVLISGNGEQTRDFLYIDDAVSALIKAGEKGHDGIFNVGSGKEVVVNDLAEKIGLLLKAKVMKNYSGSFEGAKRSALDYLKFKNEFNWDPKVSLEEGLKKTIDHMNENSLEKIKTCHVTTVDITARFIILGFLKFLKREKSQVYVVSSFSKFKPVLQKEGFILKDIKMTRRITPAEDLVSFVKLFMYFRKEKFDIVHTYTPKAGILGRIAARLAGVPIVIHTSYGLYIGDKLPKRLRFTILFAEKVASWFCDRFFSQNQEDIELAVKKGIVNPKKIKLLYYGIDVKRFNPANFDDTFINNKKRELGIADRKVVGMVGRFVQEKGYLVLFSAFKIIKEKYPDAVLLLVAPKDKEKADALDISVFEKYGVSNDVILLGYEQEVSEIEQIYPLMDIFVLPSYREGFPYSIMEASASSKPVVASNIRGCREAVQENKTGLLFEAGDHKKLAEKIIYLLSRPEELREMGRRGREKAEKDFDENVVFDKIKEEYNRLIKEKLLI